MVAPVMDDQSTKVSIDSQIVQIPIDLLDDHPGNLIYNISEESVRELAGSIREYGVLEPLHIMKKGSRYQIISGHRRKLASALVGLKTVPCIEIKDTGEASDGEILLEHNRTQREKSVMEKAHEIRELKKQYGKRRGRPKGEEKLCNDCTIIFEELNLSKSTFYLYDRLNDLIPELQAMVENGSIGLTLGSKIGGLAPEVQTELYEYLGDDIKDIGPKEITRLKKQNDRGYLVLEVMQKRLKDFEIEVEQRRQKDGDIANLEKRIQVLRNKKKTLEYDLSDYMNATSRAREQILKNGAALLSVTEELVRPVAGARPKIEALLETPLEPATATHLVKWAQVLVEVGQKLESAAKKALLIQGGKSDKNEPKNPRHKPVKTKGGN